MEKLTLAPNLIGTIFIIAGLIMLIFPPKKINSLYGYRTPRSMKSIENWNLAQKFSSKLLLVGGFFLLLMGIVAPILDVNQKLINLIGIITMISFVVILIILTEIKIKNFEKTL